ncbi:MAG TPA: BatD family protein, partial [Fibrobacteria bacterium]|nr:BatD family protein [Fibrobacteria bacterium]
FSVTRNTATSSSSQTTIINGALSRSTSFITDFIYVLTAREGGTYTLGPITYNYNDTDRDLGRAVVTVTQAEPGVSMRSSLNKQRVYAGEQVLYMLRIMPKDVVQSIDRPDDLQKRIGEKFYFQQLDNEIVRRTAVVDGRETPVYDIRIALFPLLSGPARLEGISITYRQLRPGVSQGQTFLDMFFGGGGSVVTQTATASPLRLNVTPLPPGAPADFTGSVGTYSLKASLSQAVVAAGEPVTLTVTVRGNGTPKSITRPTLPDLPHFEVYPPEESGASVAEGAELWTTRVFEYVLIPGREGSHQLGRISFPYFDPGRGAYVRAESAPLALRVTPGKAGTPASPLATPREITALGADIRHIRTGDFRLRDDSSLPFSAPAFYGLVLLPPLAFAGAFAVRRRRARLRTDAALSRRTRAGAERRRRFREAHKALGAGQARDFYRALAEAVTAFPSDKLNREFRGLTLPEAMALLAAHGAAAETVTAYEALMQRCDLVLFAGLNPPSPEMHRDLAGAEALLTRLDKELS